MKIRCFILGTVVVAVMGGVVVRIWQTSDPGLTTSASEGRHYHAGQSKFKTTRLPSVVENRRAPMPPGESPTEEIPIPDDPSLPANHLTPAGVSLVRNPLPISEQELRLRAAAVEQEANHDLKHLVGLLDLTETQQDRIFDSLVRHTPGWHPAMQAVGVTTVPVPAGTSSKPPDSVAPVPTVGTAGTETNPDPSSRSSLLDAIARDLTPDQQIELANAELERQEWWEEIIPRLLPNEDIPPLTGDGSTAGVAASPPPPPDKTDEDPAVLAE